MTTLHLISRSPFGDNCFNSCLRVLAVGDGLLLMGDAVYALQPKSVAWNLLEVHLAETPVFALLEDVLARDLQVSESVQLLDYPAFVQKTLEFSKVNSWL